MAIPIHFCGFCWMVPINNEARLCGIYELTTVNHRSAASFDFCYLSWIGGWLYAERLQEVVGTIFNLVTCGFWFRSLGSFHDCFYCLFWFWYFIHIVQGTDVLIHALLSFDCYLLCHSNKIKNVSASFWLIWNWFDHCELLSDSHIITSWCTAKMCRLSRSWVCAIQVALSSHRSLSPCWRSVIGAMTRRSHDLVHSLNHG